MTISGIILHLNRDYIFIGLICFVLVITSIIILSFSLNVKKKFRNMYQSLYYREELFQLLCTNIDDIIIIYHFGKHRIEYVSPNLERIYGVSIQSFKKNPYILINQSDILFKNKIKALFTTNIVMTNHEIECTLFHPINKQFSTLLLRVYPVLSHQLVVRYIISVSDLTKEKQSQQALQEALINVKKANEAKKEFLSHMSHEIRTPINAVNGMAQIALNSLEDRQKVKHSLERIIDASKMLNELLNNILDMSKLDSNKIILNKEPFQITELISLFSDFMKAQADQYHINFEATLKNIVHDHLLGDSLRLLQILTNCMSNSMKFTPAGGYTKIEIAEQSFGDNTAVYRFIMNDTGKGMSEKYMERLFTPFEQEDASIAREYGGTGLGMAITKNLITLMSGDIHVSSKPGAGTTITIEIPFEVMKISDIQEKIIVSAPTFREYDFRGHNILIVEDNDVNVEVIKEFLRYTGINPVIAKSGKEAIRLFEASESSCYSIILMDIQMPELNGYETAKRIRESSHPDANTVCIIAMSADYFAEDISESLSSGMNYHIPKPVDIDQLYQLLDKIINKK